MFLVKNKVIPSKYWVHDLSIKNNDNKTVYDILKDKHMPIPPEWDPNIEHNLFNFPNKDENGDTEAIRLAKKGIIPDKKYEHNPNVVNN